MSRTWRGKLMPRGDLSTHENVVKVKTAELDGEKLASSPTVPPPATRPMSADKVTRRGVVQAQRPWAGRKLFAVMCDPPRPPSITPMVAFPRTHATNHHQYQAHPDGRQGIGKLAGAIGFEPTTLGFGDRCSTS